jgi:hypothetical protein
MSMIIENVSLDVDPGFRKAARCTAAVSSATAAI